MKQISLEKFLFKHLADESEESVGKNRLRRLSLAKVKLKKFFVSNKVLIFLKTQNTKLEITISLRNLNEQKCQSVVTHYLNVSLCICMGLLLISMK